MLQRTLPRAAAHSAFRRSDLIFHRGILDNSTEATKDSTDGTTIQSYNQAKVPLPASDRLNWSREPPDTSLAVFVKT